MLRQSHKISWIFCQNKVLQIFTFFFLLLGCSAQVLCDEIDDKLSKLDPKERECLTYFFMAAIKNDHLGHVLFFSSKPASLVAAPLNTPGSALFLEGWEVWKKYESLFPHPNFHIYHEIVPYKEGRALHVYFINKRTLRHLCEEKNVFAREVRGILKGSCKAFLAKDQAFMGFMLGYGLEASTNYKRDHASLGSSSRLRLILCGQNGKIVSERQGGEERLLFYLNPAAHILPITFLGDPSSKEVKALKKKYTYELMKLEELILKEKLLKHALQALTRC